MQIEKPRELGRQVVAVRHCRWNHHVTRDPLEAMRLPKNFITLWVKELSMDSQVAS